MFSKKKTISSKNRVQNEQKDHSLKVSTIPDDFYAGANPTIQFKEVEKTIDLNKFERNKLKNYEKKILDETTSVGSQKSGHPANFLTSRKFLIISVIILFIFFIAIATWYYLWQINTEKVIEIPDTITEHIKVVDNMPINPVTTTTVTISTTTATSTAVESNDIGLAKDIGIEFPSILLAESTDFDGDGITDMAEDVFNLDPANSDTDNDKYPDNFELFYLYNPNGFEPKKIVDSGLVSVFSSNYFFYDVYYPKDWVVGFIGSDGRQTLFSTLTGENIELRVFDLSANETVEDWFDKEAKDEDLSEYIDFESRFGVLGKKRKDGLVYILNVHNHIFAFIYHVSDSSVVNYKIVIELMARSFNMSEKENGILLQDDLNSTTTIFDNQKLLNNTTTSISTSTELSEFKNTEEQQI